MRSFSASSVCRSARFDWRSALLVVALLVGTRAQAQVREVPVAFDSAGRIMIMTPPLAARLGLGSPVWLVTGDYADARLYSRGDSTSPFVLVVQRQRDVLERFPMTLASRTELAAAISRGSALTNLASAHDASPVFISEPVRGSFLASQTLLGGILFAPAASILIGDAAASAAAYLGVFGGTFFYAANLTSTAPISRAQNHLSWHSAWRGAAIADGALFVMAGDGNGSEKAYAAAALVGGIAGDVIGFQIGRPMNDAEAHGTTHGSTVAAALTGGLLGTAGMFSDDGAARAAVALTIGAGIAGYPLGLSYVRNAPYRVTAGDVGTLFPAELIGMSAAAVFLGENVDDKAIFGALTAGFAAGAVLGDRLLVRPFDHTENEARLFSLGTAAGALMGVAIPTLATADSPRAYFASAAIGGVLGAILTENIILPHRADGLGARGSDEVNDRRSASRVDVRFNPEAVLLAGLRQPGRHSLLSLTF